MGAFGAQPGSPESVYSSAPEATRPALAEFMQDPQFQAMPQNDQTAILRHILAQQQQQGPSQELARASG